MSDVIVFFPQVLMNYFVSLIRRRVSPSGRSLVEIVGSNPTGSMDIYLL
jgi:hypothetical protein